MHAVRTLLVAALLAGCGTPAAGVPPSHAELETCRRERAALERRLTSAEARIDELERETDPPEPTTPDPPPDDAETVRIQFPKDKFDSLFQDPKRLMQSGRIVPVQNDGHVTGLRIFGVRPGSPLDQLGFRNGDVVRRVNELDVTSPDKALEAYQAVRQATELRIEMLRQGRPFRLVLEVVEPRTN